jgi:hypothetical protein
MKFSSQIQVYLVFGLLIFSSCTFTNYEEPAEDEKLVLEIGDRDFCFSMAETVDGRLILAGQTRISGNDCAMTVSLNPDGSIYWLKTFENHSGSSLRKAVTDADGYLYFSGYQGPNPWLIKMTRAGEILWENTSIVSGCTIIFDFCINANNHPVIVCINSNNMKLAFAEFSSTGEMLSIHDADFSLIAPTIRPLPDGGYLITGTINSCDIGIATTLKLDASFNILWTYDVTPAQSGNYCYGQGVYHIRRGYLTVGTFDNLGEPGYSRYHYAHTLSDSGSLIREREISSHLLSFIAGTQTADSGTVILSWRTTYDGFPSSPHSLFLKKISPEGYLDISTAFRFPDLERGNAVLETSGQNLIVSARTDSSIVLTRLSRNLEILPFAESD